MIPKIIHFVWLGGGRYTPSVKRCINSWREKMPDYEIKCWSEDRFDIDSVPWVKEAVEKKKWALASDYIRHWAVFAEGGVYMDTDVMVYKHFDKFLDNSFFTSVEYHPVHFNEQLLDDNRMPLYPGKPIPGLGLLSACFGAEKGHPFIKECMNWYESHHFIKSDGSLYLDMIAPSIMAMQAIKFGFKYIDIFQPLSDGMKIYPSSVFSSGVMRTKNSYSMHFSDGSWKEKTLKESLKDTVRMWFPFIFRK